MSPGSGAGCGVVCRWPEETGCEQPGRRLGDRIPKYDGAFCKCSGFFLGIFSTDCLNDFAHMDNHKVLSCLLKEF